jgi:hypothetical protein
MASIRLFSWSCKSCTASTIVFFAWHGLKSRVPSQAHDILFRAKVGRDTVYRGMKGWGQLLALL